MKPGGSCYALLFAALLGGCAEAAEGVKVRATNDFGCNGDQSLGAGAYRAVGCGRSRIYDCQASEAYRGTTTGYSCHPEQGSDSEVESESVLREEDQEAPLAPRRERDRSRCRAAYRRIDELTTLWVEWYQGEAAPRTPGPAAFERACMMVADDTQVCLVPDYARTHKDACVLLLEKAPLAREGLSRLLLAR
jgi:hypothetical protein